MTILSRGPSKAAPRPASPLCIALDIGDRDELIAVARATSEQVGALKIGLGGFVTFGPDIVGEVGRLAPVFLDLKLHDIPAQVERAARAVGELGASYTTVHALGGSDMMKAAVAGAGATAVLAVTVLTSMEAATLASVGIDSTIEEAVVRLAELALSAGVDGLVCSPHEIGRLREAFGPEPLLVAPGIRPRGAEQDDQRRTLDARAAVGAGADLIVVGRPIIRHPDPSSAAGDLLDEIRA